MAYVSHMTFVEAHRLQIGDKVDHRNSHGKFVRATIIHKTRSGILKLHYDGLSHKYDTECSYINELNRFAIANSVSQRPAHRLKYIKTGSFVDINIPQHPGWRKAEVVTNCPISGQIQVQYLLDISEGRSEPMKWIRWTHLDNTAEVSRFGVHTYLQYGTNDVAISLETNRAYSRTPADLRESCATECIQKIFGGMHNILPFLIKHSSPSQLQHIQQILKAKNIEYHDNNTTPKGEDIEGELTQCQKKITSLSDLSRNAIMHICGFLNREDIKAFKLTSYQNGIACLGEMTKCNVGVSDVNAIINDENNHFVDDLGMSIRKSYKYHRYNGNMDYLSLRLQWQETYHVPLEQQLLLSENQTACRFYDTPKNDKMAEFKIRAIPTPKFLLFDKRNTIKFDEESSKPKIMDICNEKQQSIVFIKWFDIYFQEIVPLQFIMGNHNEMTINRLTEYLENEFIATTNKQKEWHSKLLTYFKKMDQINSNYPKLICFKEYRHKVVFANDINETIPWWGVCVFQLNTTHPAFAKYKFTSILEKYKLLKSLH